ncbi:MAG TPA: cytochrome c biogenesis protein CcdA [Methylocystis sp.]|jgi:cytochrome c-type biogenesis protein
MAADVTFPAAAAAGLLSFLSPCVLPLVPPYLTFIAGVTLEDLSSESRSKARRDIFLASLFFVFGFGTVFTALGATASFFGQALRANMEILSYAAGAIIIAMGVHFLGFLKIPLLYREKRATVEKPMGLLGAYVMGLAFAFGWTPCIGPILAAILAIASTEETVWRGAQLLTAYSLGLGVPFLGAALAMEPFLGFISRFKRHFAKVEKIVGALLVLTGIAFLTGGVQSMSFWLLQTFPGLANFG